ncbi:MAG: TonB-dependent receptor, partial [Kordiimonas sp.]
SGNQFDQSQQASNFGVDVVRDSKNTLTTADFKISKADIFALPAGDVGFAAGVEWRRETISDNRDSRLDGSTTFTNPITGQVFDSDILGVSATGDVDASRNVYSAYAEAIVPVLADLPMIESFNLQLAARFESYSDIGADVLKPRIAASWYVTDWVQVRGAWSKGFRAPNLEQVNAPEFSRFTNSQADYSRCTDIGECDDRAVISRITGNPDLQPEDSTNYSLGIVIQPPVLDGLTLTLDYWNVKQSGTVGTIQRNDQIALDEYFRRTQGTSNPDVVRADVTADDIAAFEGTGVDPFGEIVFVRQTFLNLQDRETAGVDFNATYRGIETGIGEFTLKFNAAYLDKFEQQPFNVFAPLLDDAIASGNLDSLSSGDLRRIESRPKWRYNFTILWDSGNWGAGLNGRYVGSVIDTGVTVTSDSGEVTPFPISSWFTLNSHADYTFEGGALDNMRVRFGVKNLFNEAPPLFDNSAGYSSGLHSIRGREFYLSLRKKF